MQRRRGGVCEQFDTKHLRTHHAEMGITLSADGQLIEKARRCATSHGTTPNQLLLMERLDVLPVSGELIRSALELMAAYSLAFWSATIVVAAQLAGRGQTRSDRSASRRRARKPGR